METCLGVVPRTNGIRYILRHVICGGISRHGVKVSYAHNGMQLLQVTTNACNEYPDNQSVCAQASALRTLEVPHWKSMSNVLPILLWSSHKSDLEDRDTTGGETSGSTSLRLAHDLRWFPWITKIITMSVTGADVTPLFSQLAFFHACKRMHLHMLKLLYSSSER